MTFDEKRPSVTGYVYTRTRVEDGKTRRAMIGLLSYDEFMEHITRWNRDKKWKYTPLNEYRPKAVMYLEVKDLGDD